MDDNEGCFTLFMFVIGFVIGVIMVYFGFVADVPSAMDVYQGKTELEYTYRNGVAVDSVVVFKEK